jgi:DNA-binding HxlR family transcriptional regulator
MQEALCPSENGDQLTKLILDQIADKWSVLIITALCVGPMRFNALKRELNGVTQKALTQTLRRLERLGLLDRHVFPVSPLAVEYRVTPLGESLKEPFQALFQWTVANSSEIEAAKDRFDLARGEGDRPDGARVAATPGLGQ